MALVRIDAAPARETLRRLGALARERARDSTPLLREIAALMLRSTETNFAVEGRPPWKPLKPATRRRKQRLGRSPRILRETGALEGSIRARAEGGRGRQLGGAAVVETRVSYAAVHQFGSPRRSLPARLFFRLTEAEGKRLRRLVIDFARLK